MTLSRRWVRSWPVLLPEPTGNHVVDELPRLHINNYDLAENPASWTVLRDCTLVEWDIVLRPEDMLLWEHHVGVVPNMVHVAPYPVYRGPGYDRDDWQSRGDGATAAQFGFGIIWFPAAVVDRFHEAEHNPHALWFTDGTFAAWYSRAYGGALVHPDVRPVHLNYRVSLPAAPDEG